MTEECSLDTAATLLDATNAEFKTWVDSETEEQHMFLM